MPYTVVHGSGPERLANAWNTGNSTRRTAQSRQALQAEEHARIASLELALRQVLRSGCEHRLFTDLLAGRTG